MARAVAVLLLAGLVACGGERRERAVDETPPREEPAANAVVEPEEPPTAVDPLAARDAAVKARSYTQEIPGTDASFDMVWVPAGRFWIGKTEVTWDQYEIYALGEEPPNGVDAVARPSKPYHPYDRGWGTEARPACGMTRDAAVRYCEWLSKRTGRTYALPSGAEWQLAFDEGQKPEPTTGLRRRAWFAVNSGDMTHPVATLAPNALGIHDMLGNVMEYTTDTAPEDENGDRWPILRGGSFADPAEKVNGTHQQPQLFAWHEREPQRPRSAWWLCDGPYTGFRLIRRASEDEAR